jgi:hypothetical protein
MGEPVCKRHDLGAHMATYAMNLKAARSVVFASIAMATANVGLARLHLIISNSQQ